MSTVACIRFHYEGNAAYEDAVEDLDALDAKLLPNTVISRRGRNWRVSKVEVQRPHPADPPLWLVYLSEYMTKRGGVA